MSIKVGHCGTTYSIDAKIIEVGMHPAEYLMPDIYFEMQFLYYYLVEKIVCPNSFTISRTTTLIIKVYHAKVTKASAQVKALSLQLLWHTV
jgi:hypothetical protein